MRCRNCGAELPEGSFCCESCGAAVTDVGQEASCRRDTGSGVCPRCGRQTQADDRFCGFCGYRLAPEPRELGEGSGPRNPYDGPEPREFFNGPGSGEPSGGPGPSEPDDAPGTREILVEPEPEEFVNPEGAQEFFDPAGSEEFPELSELLAPPETGEPLEPFGPAEEESEERAKPAGAGGESAPRAGAGPTGPAGLSELRTGAGPGEPAGPSELQAGAGSGEPAGLSELQTGADSVRSAGSPEQQTGADPAEPTRASKLRVGAGPGGPAGPSAPQPGQEPSSSAPRRDSRPQRRPARHEDLFSDVDIEIDDPVSRRLPFRILVPLATVAAVLVALAAIFQFMFRGPEERQQTELLYYSGASLYLADVEERDKDRMITDVCVDSGVAPHGGLVTGDMLSEDGDFLFYREEYDGRSFDLFRWELKKETPEKIASQVTSYKPLPDNTLVYMRDDSLYYYGEGEPVRLGRGVTDWQTDEEGKHIFWQESDGKDSICYYQGLKGREERVELEKNSDQFYANDTLTRFLSLKGGVLYLIGPDGEKERIAQDVVHLASFDLDTEEIYYLTDGPVRLAYTDVADDDDEEMTEENWLRLADLDQFDLPYKRLRYHRLQGDAMISDRCFWTADDGSCISLDGDFCLYLEGPVVEDIRLEWRRLAPLLEEEDFGTALLKQLQEEGQLSGMRLAIAERTAAEYEELDGRASFPELCYDGGGKHFYMNVIREEEGTGTLYEVPLTGSGAGDRREIDDAAGRLRTWVMTGDGIYYIRDANENGGDLYLNGQEIAYDVHGLWKVSEDILAYTADHDRNNAGGADFALVLCQNGEKTSVSKEVSYAECARDGTAVLLSGYDFLKGEGDLVYFDGTDTEILAVRVSGFAARGGSTAVE